MDCSSAPNVIGPSARPKSRPSGCRAVSVLVAAAAALLCLVADGRFPVRESEPPPRRFSNLDRLSLARLSEVHADIQALALQRRDWPPEPGLTDYRIICHAHAEDSAHTGGTRAEMLAAARRAGVSAILLTDHFRPPRDFMESWRGFREGVLFIPGSETRGFLIHPTRPVMDAMALPVPAFLETVRSQGGLAFLSHLEERPDHPMDGLDGLEIYNRHWDAKRDRLTLIALALKLTNPREAALLREALERFPAEVLGAQVDYPADYLAKWDGETARRRLTGIAANDAHHNQVMIVKYAGDDTVLLGTEVDPDEKKQRVAGLLRPGIREMIRGRQPGDVLVRLDFDPYHLAFRNVSTHLLAPELTEAAVRDALRAGRVYVAHDWMGDPTGFRFTLHRSGTSEAPLPMGTERAFGSDQSLRLQAHFPLPCSRIRLLRSGQQVDLGRGYALAHTVRQPGVYRVEGWLRLGGEERCWILSNPIYLR